MQWAANTIPFKSSLLVYDIYCGKQEIEWDILMCSQITQPGEVSQMFSSEELVSSSM